VALALLLGRHTPLNADMIVLVATDVQRGIDNAPRDGIFDSLLLNPGSTTVTLGPPTGSEERAALIFHLADVPAGAVITSATLSLQITAGLDPNLESRIDGYAPSGSTIVNVHDLEVSNPLLSFIHAPTGSTQSLDIPVDFLQSLLDGGAEFAGLTIRNTSVGTFSFASNPALPTYPTLTVQFTPAVPEPSTLTLLACGAFALLGYARRRRARGAGRGDRPCPVGAGPAAE
jgi:hypothetical protein